MIKQQSLKPKKMVVFSLLEAWSARTSEKVGIRSIFSKLFNLNLEQIPHPIRDHTNEDQNGIYMFTANRIVANGSAMG